jgi:hypothetical protein
MRTYLSRSIAILGLATTLLSTGACRSPVVATRSSGNAPPAAAASPATTSPTTGTGQTGTGQTSTGQTSTGQTGTRQTGTGQTGTRQTDTGEGGPGTVTVAITEPVTVSGHAGTNVACQNTARRYTATAQSATINGYQISLTVRIAGYRGPGTYPAVVTVRLDGAGGEVTTVSAVPGINATVTTEGGSFSIKATGDNGRTLAASAKWICS